jgi:hypothetical protein
MENNMKKLIISLSLICVGLNAFSQKETKSGSTNNPLSNEKIDNTGLAYAIPACATTNPGWLLGGNSMSSVPIPNGYTGFAGGQILGTCDNFDLIFEANSKSAFWLKPSGLIGIGIGNGNPAAQLDVLVSGTNAGLSVRNSSKNLFSIGNDGSTLINSTSSTVNTPLTVTGTNATGITASFANTTGAAYKTFLTTATPAYNYNGTIKTNDNAIIWDNGTNGGNVSNGLVLGAWNGPGSLRIDATGGTNITCNSTTVSSLKINNTTLGTSTNAQTAFEVAANGKVFIGPQRPTTANTKATNAYLNVGGDVVIGNSGTTAGIYLAQSNWSDFVFDKSYKLMPLNEVEKFYKENHHLPNVPTTKDIQENGNNLGQTDAVLLQKIEENTLYIVELKKQLEVQKKLIQALDKKLADKK